MGPSILEDDVTNILGTALPWCVFSGSRVLVTGAAGMLPSLMVETLLGMKARLGFGPDQVIGLVRTPARAQSRFAAHAGNPALDIISGDVSNPPNIDGPVDFVIHAASQASPSYYGVDPVGTILPNTIGTWRMLELARTKQSKGFLFFSSGEVYGQVSQDRLPISENHVGFVDPLSVRSCYAEGKRAGETLCVCWAHQYGAPVRIVRPFHTYGPGMPFDGRVFADFVADILARRDIVMKSDGMAERPFCYAADAVAGFFIVLLRGENAQAYNIAAEQPVSIIDLAETLAAAFADRGIRVRRSTASPDPSYLCSPINRQRPNIARALNLGWRPQTSLVQGFRRTVASFEQGPGNPASPPPSEPCQGPRACG